MDAFMDALVSKDTETIPPEYDWFAPLLGDWDFWKVNSDVYARRRSAG